MDKLYSFLIEAKKQTYANENIKKEASSRKGSNDYEYSKDNMTYHDTFFGGLNFIGEEVVYKDDIPVWGMNYYGTTLDEKFSEEAMDKALRPALMQVGNDDIIPVRGPKRFINGEYEYKFEVIGNLNNFNGKETVFKNNNKIFELICHSGKIV